MAPTDPVSVLSLLAPSPLGVEVCSCDEALALRRELAAARARIGELEGAAIEIAASGDFRVFCPECGVIGVGGGFDADGCCSTCGGSTCTVGDVEAHLARVGLRVDRGEPPPESGAARQLAIASAWGAGGAGDD